MKEVYIRKNNDYKVQEVYTKICHGAGGPKTKRPDTSPGMADMGICMKKWTWVKETSQSDGLRDGRQKTQVRFSMRFSKHPNPSPLCTLGDFGVGRGHSCPPIE